MGVILTSVFYFLQFVFPTFSFWIFGFVPGFVPGLAVGALTKDLRRGIKRALLSVFLGSIVGGVIAYLYHGALNSTYTNSWLVWGLLSGLWLCLPAAAGGSLGTLFSKKASLIRGFMVRRKRTVIITIAIVCLSLTVSVAGVMLFAKISHERCDGLVQLLKDQYFYKVTEKPMHFREEAFVNGIKLVDCGGDNEKFLSELFSSEGVSKAYYFKPSTGAYVWFTEYTSVCDRLVYVRYGSWQFQPTRYWNSGFFGWWIITGFVLPIFILIFTVAMSTEIERPEEAITKAQLRSIPKGKYPEELAIKYQSMYPHNPAGVLEFHISRKMKERKTREQAIKELIKASG